MSDEAAPKKTGGKNKRLIMIVGAVLLLGGGGGAAGFFVAGGMKKEAGPKIDPSRPQLVLKGENAIEIGTKYAALAHEEAGHGGGEHGGGEGHGKGIDLPRPKDPSAYEATYFQIPAPFTTNLSDSDAFAQIAIAVSTYYDNRVIQAVQTHELAIRSAILMMLAQQQEIDLATPQGKEQLQVKLVGIINGVLKSKSGYGGIDNVYFTNFVIQ
jgi:flagellar protein FliL